MMFFEISLRMFNLARWKGCRGLGLRECDAADRFGLVICRKAKGVCTQSLEPVCLIDRSQAADTVTVDFNQFV